jgi:hypothetical protein
VRSDPHEHATFVGTRAGGQNIDDALDDRPGGQALTFLEATKSQHLPHEVGSQRDRLPHPLHACRDVLLAGWRMKQGCVPKKFNDTRRRPRIIRRIFVRNVIRFVADMCNYLGHSSIRVTSDRYGHLFPQARVEMAAALDATFQATIGRPLTAWTRPEREIELGAHANQRPRKTADVDVLRERTTGFEPATPTLARLCSTS